MFLSELLDLFGTLRLGVYQRLFSNVSDREGSLSATEAFSVDVIHLLGTPTLNQFSAVLGLSQPNATYKINSLAAKGYVTKEVSSKDRREILIRTTEKFDRYYTEKQGLEPALAELRREFTPEELETTQRVLAAFNRHVKEGKQKE